MQKHYIQDQQALVELCQQVSQSDMVVIDTEFVRTRTLYPKLGLLQLCDGNHLALIDPLEISDLTPFWQLLSQQSLTKVIHACSEDLEVFLTAGKTKPVNLIDSQIMMSFLGHGLSVGYAAMVQHYLGLELDKSESRTDWTKRPLTAKQLSYAEADVDHLFTLYPKLLAELTEKGWLAAAKQETQIMIDKKFTPIDESELYRNIKMSWRLNPPQLYRLQQLAIWRYQRAQVKDQPLSFIAKDHTLVAVAQYNPKSTGAMANIEGVEMLDVRHQGKAMLNVLKKCIDVDASLFPAKITRLDEYPGYKQTFKKVKSFVKDAAEKADITVENLASKKQINQFLSWHYGLNGMENRKQQVDIVQGWRLTLFGEQLIAYAENGFK